MITENDIKYAQRLRALRVGNGIKQELMFERLGLNSRQEYSKLENGKMNFTDDLISKISKSFNISPNEFTNPDAEINRLNNQQANTHNSSDKNEDFVNQLLKAKDETIATQKELIQQLKKSLDNQKKSDH